jgi:OOP family OmpA-OmpF porin
MKLTKLLFVFVALVVLYVVAMRFNLVPSRLVQKSAAPSGFTLPSDTDVPQTARAVPASTGPVTLPSTSPAPAKGAPLRLNTIPWNATFGLAFANGGPITTAGSLMDKHGVRLKITRQNNQTISQEDQAKFASAYANDPNTTEGTQFVIIMGDGAAQYLADLNKLTKRVGDEYRGEVVGAVGYSDGEDAFMGPEEWKTDPSSARGGVVAGVLRDGDWNIALYWLAQNGIKNNPDERTYDPDALNWVSVDDFTKAGQLFIEGHCEDRDVVRDGKRTGAKKNACVQAVVTWTPGDVEVAKKKGGLVKILSTKENRYQMPSTIIGIRKFNRDNAKRVEELLAAAFEGADALHSDAALQRAAKAQHAILLEQTPAYWLKYYKGVTESDKRGLPVPLGGSRVANLADNLVLFGLAEGSGGVENSIFKATYDGFGKIAKQQYPRLISDYPALRDAVNPQFVQALAARSANTTNADVAKFDEAPTPIEKENVVAKRNWNIQFDTGKASFTPQAQATLDDLYQQLTVGGLAIEIDGHTDNVGSPDKNKTLSEQRAFAVKQWLQGKAPTLFPDNRINVRAFGDTAPLASNDTPDGRAQNRRVTVILGTR